MKKVEKELEELIGNRKHRIPYWDELPDIELYMDQVISLMDKYFSNIKTKETETIISHSMINNYVKLGIMPAPYKKKYSREHLAYLLIIGLLKPVLPLPEISRLIQDKLEKQSIEELLNYFSDTYDSIIVIATRSFGNYCKDSTTKLDIATYTSIVSSFTKFISMKILDEKIEEVDKEKLEEKDKPKEKKKSK